MRNTHPDAGNHEGYVIIDIIVFWHDESSYCRSVSDVFDDGFQSAVVVFRHISVVSPMYFTYRFLQNKILYNIIFYWKIMYMSVRKLPVGFHVVLFRAL